MWAETRGVSLRIRGGCDRREVKGGENILKGNPEDLLYPAAREGGFLKEVLNYLNKKWEWDEGKLVERRNWGGGGVVFLTALKPNKSFRRTPFDCVK